jgi:hypothetical protein
LRTVESILGNVPREQSLLPSVVRTNENLRLTAKRVVVGDATGPSTAPLGGRGSGSAKNKATRILSAAPGAISPHMQRSFVDRHYSPSIGMN